MPGDRMRRSALFVPGAKQRALEKASALTLDVVILDLEDAVAPGQKSAARAMVAEALQARAFEGREVVVRVNPPETPEGVADLEAVLPGEPDAILLPKVDAPSEIEGLCAMLDQTQARRGMALWAMIETPLAVVNLPAIAALGARRRLAALVVGLNDLEAALHTRRTPGRDASAAILSQVVVAARAHGLTPLDAVYNDHRDVEGFAREADQARTLGFAGKTLIHPDQIAPTHDAFAPTSEELDWARRVVAAFQIPENLEHGAISVDGRMLERMHFDDAKRTLAMASEAA